jgi:hypothetical protein
LGGEEEQRGGGAEEMAWAIVTGWLRGRFVSHSSPKAGKNMSRGNIPNARKLLGTISFVANAVGNNITNGLSSKSKSAEC